ncbi:3270_t:CDS:2, partial [Acaulospora morrowiae]
MSSDSSDPLYWLHVDLSLKEDKVLFSRAQKLFAMIFAFGQTTISVITGLYNNLFKIRAGVCLLLVIQLVVAGLISILLDELLQKGYAFSLTTVNTGQGFKFKGAIISLFHLLFTYNNKTCALKESFYRTNLPNVMNLLATMICGTYLIKLFYISNMPIILQSALTINVFLISQMLYTWFLKNIFVYFLDVWTPHEGSSQLFVSED